MNKCPKCSKVFSPDTAGGLCPTCLLEQGLDSEAGVTAAPDAATSSDAALPGDVDRLMSPEKLMTLLPQFDQIELIGRGGMGVVYKARQKNLERFIALKVLSPEVAGTAGFAERFSREARAMARLNHPNIVAVYDFGSIQHAGANLYYLTMEFVDGSNLRAMLKQLTPDQALAIVPQICEALQYAHDIGIVHRDIKPENILIDKRGRVRIADFGLAKLLQQARSPADYTLTRPDLVMGTPSYMAPEQLERPADVDHRSDLYSLGVVFYEMLTGQLPKGRFPLPSQSVRIDVRLDEVVLKALEHDRELRYQHASEVQTSVEAVRGTPLQPPATARPAASISPAGDPPAVELQPGRHVDEGTSRISPGALRLTLCLLAVLLLFAGCLYSGKFSSTGGWLSIGKPTPWYEVKWGTEGSGFAIHWFSFSFACVAASALLFLRAVLVKSMRRVPPLSAVAVLPGPHARPGHESMPGQPAPLKPRFRIWYFLLCTVIFTVAFYAALALWNLRWPGVALGGVVIFVALGAATALGRNFRVLLAHWKTDSPIKAVFQFAFCLTCCVGGYYFVLGGTFADRERNLFLYRDTSNFSKEYTGKEYQLVRLLPSYQHTVPQVELTDAYARPAYANSLFRDGVFDLSIDPADINFRLLMGFWLLGSGVVMLFVGGGRMLKPNRSWRVWIWPATLLLAIIVGWWACGFMQDLLGFIQLGSTLSGGEPVKFSLNDVQQPLQACLTSHGYAPADINMYSMSRIPDGEKIGFAGVENFVKPSPFDRWRWTGGRLVPTQPTVQLFYVTTAWQPPNSYGLPSAAAAGAPHPETYVMWTVYGTSLDNAAAYAFNDQLHSVVEATQPAATSRSAPSEPAMASTQPAESRIEMHGTKSVPATHDELVHILAELPKAFTQDLAGSPEQQIKALGTKVWALDFDRGPASFWLAVHEAGQTTFPARLPTPFRSAVWRVENSKARVLMWLQPREEAVEMSPQVLSSVRKRAADLPDYAVGIDVDGKSVLRETHDPGLSKPQIPLWFGWVNRELQESSGAIDFDPKTGVLQSRNQAMAFIRAKKTPNGTPGGTVEFGLWYLSDNASALPATQPVTSQPVGDSPTLPK